MEYLMIWCSALGGALLYRTGLLDGGRLRQQGEGSAPFGWRQRWQKLGHNIERYDGTENGQQEVE